MIVRDQTELDRLIEGMRPGERVVVEGTIKHLWPRSPIYVRDDYLSEDTRAMEWCHRRGCELAMQFETGDLIITKHPLASGVDPS